MYGPAQSSLNPLGNPILNLDQITGLSCLALPCLLALLVAMFAKCQQNIRSCSLQKKGWRSTLALTYSAIGVVYGDVGTSPLYVFSSTFTENTPSETDVLGAMSIIFWTITLID